MRPCVLLCLLLASPALADDLQEWVRARVGAQRDALAPAPTAGKGTLWRERRGTSGIPNFVPPTSLAPLVTAVRPAVVNIATDNEGASRSLGSGFVISADGLVVTNNHVVEKAQAITVRLSDGRELEAEVVGRDPETDLALLRLPRSGTLPTVTLGDSDALQVGDWVVAIGNPFGLDTSITHGLLTARERVIGMGPWDDFLQTNALINPGNSGGPLFDMHGDVVGVTTAVMSRAQGIGFAVPINLVKDLLPNLMENGRLVRGWVGMSAKEGPEGGPRGPVVTDVFRQGPAQEGGVRPGDRVASIDGRPVDQYQDLLRRIALKAPGTQVRLGLVRAGKPLEVKVTLAARPAEVAIKAMVGGGRIDAVGLTLRELDAAALAKAGVDKALKVEAIVPGSPSELAGLAPGDLVLEVNRLAVGTLADLSAAWDAGRGAETVLVRYRRGDSTRYVSLTPSR